MSQSFWIGQIDDDAHAHLQKILLHPLALYFEGVYYVATKLPQVENWFQSLFLRGGDTAIHLPYSFQGSGDKCVSMHQNWQNIAYPIRARLTKLRVLSAISFRHP